jgi:hypothetical protein
MSLTRPHLAGRRLPALAASLLLALALLLAGTAHSAKAAGHGQKRSKPADRHRTAKCTRARKANPKTRGKSRRRCPRPRRPAPPAPRGSVNAAPGFAPAAPPVTPTPSATGGGWAGPIASTPPPTGPGGTGGSTNAGGSTTSGGGTVAAPFRFFSESSFWNVPLAADAPLDESSAGLVARFGEEVNAEKQAGNGPNITTSAYSIPVYTVRDDQPTVPVTLANPQGETNAPLSAAWSAVPLPPDAHPATGTDGALVVWQPDTDKMWEFWQLRQSNGEWLASWGGAMRNVSSNQGIFGPDAWEGAQSWWGTSATSLPLVGGLMTIEELKRGEINHVLSLSIPKPRAHTFSWPAQRTDGYSTDPQSLPEGARLRLDPNLDLDSLNLPHMTLMIARAAQRYGMVVRDQSGVISLNAQDPTPTGTDPYWGPNGLFEGKNPRQLLAAFPWEHLHVLKMQLQGG